MKIVKLLRKLSTTFLTSVGRLPRRKSSQAATRFTLEIELLEIRICPADYYWRPQALGGGMFSSAMSDGRNWNDGAAANANQYLQNQGPGVNSILFFDGLGNQLCEVDADKTFAAIFIDPTYTAVLRPGSRKITFNGKVGPQQGTVSEIDYTGTFDGGLPQPGSMTFKGSPLTLKHATFDSVNLENFTGNTTTINTNTITFNNCSLLNYGTLDWDGTNTINFSLQSTLENAAGGTFNLSDGGSITAQALNPNLPLPRAKILNYGTMTKSGINTITTINSDFENLGGGSLGVSATLQLNRAASQSGASSRTILDGGTLAIVDGAFAGTYSLDGGILAGNGTVQGNVSISGGVDARLILPGLQSAAGVYVPGTISITGDLWMNARTTLRIRTDAMGNIGVITVSGAVDFGNAGLSIIRDAGYTPAQNTSIDILTARASTGNIIANIPSNAWNANNVALQLQAIINRPPTPQVLMPFGRTRIYVRVVRQPGAGAANAAPGKPVLLKGLENDPDFNGNPITVVAVNGNASNVGAAIATTLQGSFMALSDGSFDYVPPQSFYADDSATITVSDGSISKTFNLTFCMQEEEPFPTLSITASQSAASEVGPTPGKFTISLNMPGAVDLTVYYAISGTATNGIDYTSLSGVATIPAGELSVDVFVNPVQDSLPEGTETVVLTLIPDSLYNLGLANQATVNIADSIANVVTFQNPGDQTDYRWATINLNLYASASNGASLSFTQTGLPPGLSIVNGLISGQAQIGGSISGDAGTYSVSITATDLSSGAFATIEFTWTVQSLGGLP